MTKKMLIDASHAEETRVVVLDGNRLEDFDLEAANRLPLKGNIYLAKVVRVEPSLQAAFVEYGGNRHGFLPLAEIHPDYYQIPVADRQRLLAMQAAEAREEEAAEEAEAASDQVRAADPADAATGHVETVEDAGAAPENVETIGEADAAPEGVGTVADADAAPEERVGAATEAEADAAPERVETGGEAGAVSEGIGAAEAAVDADAGREGEAGRAGGSVALAETAAPSESLRGDEPEPVLVAPPPRVEVVAEAEQATSAADPQPAAGDAPQAAEDEPAAPSPEPAEARPPEAGAPAPSGEEATIAEQSGPFLLPGEGDQPAIEHPAPAAAAVPNGHADDFDADEAPPPEEIGGEAPDEAARERRASTRFMRQYKIQEVIKRRQVMLVQVVKEERGTKGAALTTYISLAGRFSVLMPNSPRGGGVSRKITSATDRRRLREVIEELELPDGMSLIVRTAGAQRPKPEIRRDCEYLLRLWDSIRERTLASTAPALIYEEADLIKRAIRDNYARDVEEILVDGEDAYREAREFMRMLMPQNLRRIQLCREGGLFARHGVEQQLDAMHSPVVQLKSGGYVVINQTEALVAIDVNSGRSTRDRHIEDTAFRTNMEAADEIARQLRLRDLAGLIVIDFIDMESNRHDATVERRLKEALRHDRARIQVGRISHFGLLEMSRQRLRPSLAETAFVACPHCHGLGQVRSIESSALTVLRAIEEEGAKRRAAEIAVHVAGPVALYLLNRKRDRLARIEARFGMSVVFEPDDSLQPPQLRIDRLRVADAGRQQRPAEAAPSALRMDYAPEPEDEEEDAEAPEAAALDAGGEEAEEAPEARANGRAAAAEAGAEDGRRRRRRRRRRGGRGEEMESAAAGEGSEEDGEAGDEASPDDSGPAALPEGTAEAAAGEVPEAGSEDEQQDVSAADAEAQPEDAAGETPRRRRRRRGGRSGVPNRAEGDETGAPSPAPAPHAPAEPAPMQRYSGPTPADPFAGHVDDIMAAMEAAEAAAEAAAQEAATLAGRRARTAPPPPPPPSADADIAEPAPLAPSPEGEAEAEGGAVPPPPLDAGAETAEGDAAPRPEPAPTTAGEPEPIVASQAPPEAAPVLIAETVAVRRQEAAPEPMVAAEEPVQGPAVQPRSVDELAPDAPRRSGWWRR